MVTTAASDKPLDKLLDVYGALLPKSPLHQATEDVKLGQPLTGAEVPAPQLKKLPLKTKTQPTARPQNAASNTSQQTNQVRQQSTNKVKVVTDSTKKRKRDASSTGRTGKRFTWSDDMHRQFIGCIFDLGLQMAKPKLIYELMNPLPPNLTTEHIKSHLQKFRSNSKKTRDAFLEQFDIAKKLLVDSYKGKALNPGFHAYPMPVGNYPISGLPVPSEDSQNSSESLKDVDHDIHPLDDHIQVPDLMVPTLFNNHHQSEEGTWREKSARRSVVPHQQNNYDPNTLVDVGQQQHTSSQKNRKVAKTTAVIDTNSSGYGITELYHDFDHMPNRRPSLDFGNGLPSIEQEKLAKRMEAQMEMHKKIQQQHTFQQQRDTENVRPSNNSFGTESLPDLMNLSEILKMEDSALRDNEAAYFWTEGDNNDDDDDDENLFRFLTD